ncbi:PE-PPE domain-containing protein [Mycobacterium hubeiense]|uniref:PE-PPE domain-containing protein n=1 Tax=Mycobacterium hubeiense TaxID=1867256 RepID=UPI0013047B35|nr:PE-PPE domain-containing protein [Mycobacterium sp. QGD 101]
MAFLAVLAVICTVVLALASTMTTIVTLAATTALIMGGTGMKTPSQGFMDLVNDTYLGLDTAVDRLQWVQTPEHFWPATGLSDMTFDASVAKGVLRLDNDIRATPGTKVVVGYSQSGRIAAIEKRNLNYLREQGAAGVPSPDELSFLLLANPNRPNGGILKRLEGLYIPILGATFDGATPNDDYVTVDVARQYDAIADFPEYPLNLLADLNALAGYFYIHPYYGPDVVDLTDPTRYQMHTEGNTTYYLVYTENLPILQPLRDLGVPEPVVDLVQPVLRELIELGYDRTPARMGTPTRAKLFRDIDLEKLADDLADAVDEGVNDALTGLGLRGPATERDPKTPEAPADNALAGTSQDDSQDEVTNADSSKATADERERPRIRRPVVTARPNGTSDIGESALSSQPAMATAEGAGPGGEKPLGAGVPVSAAPDAGADGAGSDDTDDDTDEPSKPGSAPNSE